ncbi:MAG: DUF5117 domain-containing protein [Terrimonas sp.]|nr:DUF5117 domain-containing protein [Terrimonas sp.]
MKWILSFIVFFTAVVSAQPLPTIEEKVKGFDKQEGYLNFYWDEDAGKIWLEIDKLDQEILYQVSLPAGLGSNDIGLDRGLMGGTYIVKFSKTGKKILMIQPNYRYRANTGDLNEKAAVEQSFAQSTLWGFTVEAATGKRYLVDATDFLLRDAMQVSVRLKKMQQGNYVLDKSRSVLYLPMTKNFPLNTEFETTVTFDNNDGSAGGNVKSVSPSPEAITLRMHQSFVQLPDDQYRPRSFDPRSSFIPLSYYDYSTPVSEQLEKKFIIRHRLQKKDPLAKRSEPVKPIIYYVDHATPEPIRSALLEGASWWNQAFEAAGYINAFQVKILPEGADPMDIRYNMINWVHRSTRGWSYGEAVVDPRTGEIIKGNVSLGSLRVRQDYLIATGLLAPYETGVPANDTMLTMALQRLRQLSAHEVGHTLGLMHNYASSVNDRASVMDYPHPLIRLNEKGEMDFSDAYDNKIGEWDKVSIAWGYSDFAPGIDEDQALKKIISGALKKGLQFISDQDARAAGGLHPFAHLWDNGKDAVAALKEVMKIRSRALEQFGEKNIKPGMPMALLEDVLVPVYFYHRYQLEAVTKLVGGMNYSYALRGDGQLVTAALSKEVQMNALLAALETIEPRELVLPDRVAALIPPRPAGYDFSRELFHKNTGLAFDKLSPAESVSDYLFSFLLQYERADRLVIQEGNAKQLSLSEELETIMKKTWYAVRMNGFDALVQQQTEQVFLTYLMSLSIDDRASFAARAVVLKTLDDLEKYIKKTLKHSKDENYKAHLLLAQQRMKTPEKAKPALHEQIPPGSPIGCDLEY